MKSFAPFVSAVIILALGVGFGAGFMVGTRAGEAIGRTQVRGAAFVKEEGQVSSGAVPDPSLPPDISLQISLACSPVEVAAALSARHAYIRALVGGTSPAGGPRSRALLVAEVQAITRYLADCFAWSGAE